MPTYHDQPIPWNTSKYPLMGELIHINRHLFRDRLEAENGRRLYSEWVSQRMPDTTVLVIGYRHLNNGYTCTDPYGEEPNEWVTTSTVPALLVTHNPRVRGFYIPRENYYVEA